MRAEGAASTPGLHCKVLISYFRMAKTTRCTWPPEKPTATTPMSPARDKNFDVMDDGEVMFGGSRWNKLFDYSMELMTSLYSDWLSRSDYTRIV